MTSSEEKKSVEESSPSQKLIHNEHLFVGNMHSNRKDDGRWHRWTMFVSTSDSEIIDPQTVKDVTYLLHPSFQPNRRHKTIVPFFLSCTGWGTFQLEIVITFKRGVVRAPLHCRHLLAFNNGTTITDTESGRRIQLNRLLTHPSLTAELTRQKSGKKAGFVSETGKRLGRHLLRLSPRFEISNFKGRISSWLVTIRDACDESPILKSLDIPNGCLSIIGHFALLGAPIDDIQPSQEVVISDCSDSDIIIVAPKIKVLSVKNCDNVRVLFQSTIASAEIHHCTYTTVDCAVKTLSYRVDQSQNCEISFVDTIDRISILSFDSLAIQCMARRINWSAMDDDDQQQNSETYTLPSGHSVGSDDNAQTMDSVEQKSEMDTDERILSHRPNALTYAIPNTESGEWARVSCRWRSTQAPHFNSRPYRSHW